MLPPALGGLRLRVPPVPKQLGPREYRKINAMRSPARQENYTTYSTELSNQVALRGRNGCSKRFMQENRKLMALAHCAYIGYMCFARVLLHKRGFRRSATEQKGRGAVDLPVTPHSPSSRAPDLFDSVREM